MDLEFAAPSPPGGGRSAKPKGERATAAEGVIRLLIVEDEIFVAMNVAAMAERAGFQVLAMATTAKEAIAKAEQLRPDLVLMDIHLGSGQDGIDAAVEIWQRFDIRSLFVTAFEDQATRRRAAEAEPIGYITKPFTRRELVESIKAWMEE